MRTVFVACMAGLMILLASCSKSDNNGDLGGMWQLREWRDSTGQVIPSHRTLYYSIHRNILQITPSIGGRAPFAHISHVADRLILMDAYDNAKKDSVAIPFDSMAVFGVPPTGVFHIDCLNADRLQLSSSVGTLTFRKY